MKKRETNHGWKAGLSLCGVYVLVLALSVLTVGGCFRGLRLQQARTAPAQEIAADSALYWQGISMDPTELYNRALQQTIYLSWSETDVDGEIVNTVSGSGIILSRDGYILTNAHCVSEAAEAGAVITVELSDGRTFPAEILGADTDTDVALIRIEATGLNPAMIANQKDVKPCQTVYVMGHPGEDLKFTITSGIVSGLDREITFSDGTTLSMFQLDAAVNPGNSGGPVYNEQGLVIGMTTAKYVNLNTEGIGFAIPAEAAMKIAEDLKVYGFVRNRPLMGVTIQNAPADAVAEGSPAGARVYSVEEGLPGARAGLMKDDVIIGFDYYEIGSMQDLLDAKKGYHAFDTVTLRIWRDGAILEVKLTFDEVTPEHPTGTVEIDPEEEAASEETPPEELPPEESTDEAPESETSPEAP